MVKNLIFNDIVKDANLVCENSLDVFLGPTTTTIDFYKNIANIKGLRKFETQSSSSMVKSLNFNDISKDANLVCENSLDVFLGPTTTTIDFHKNIANIKFQTFKCVE
jgi:hypothetical protein